MSEPGASPANDGRANDDSAGLTFGPRLANAREASSLTINDIAARLRISPKQVIAIERENLSALPGPAFLRGFVRNYAKEVKLDPAPLIDALNRVLEPATQAQAPGQGRSPLVHVVEQERSSRVLVIAGAIGALIVFAVVGWVSNSRLRQEASNAMPARTASISAAPAATPMVAAIDAPTPAGLTSTQSGTAVGATERASSSPVPAADATLSPTAPGAGLTSLRFVFRDLCWVEVTQHDGKVLLSQNNEAGTEQTLTGTPPYQLVIGNASAVSLEYGGKPIDLKPATVANNVARLRLP